VPEKAKQLLQFIKPLIDVNNPEQNSQYHRLEGEVALAQGKKSQAVELFNLAQNEKSGAQTIEALARSYAAAGDLQQTIAWYQTLVETTPLPLGWEPQQDWLAAHYFLAKAYSSRGEKDKAGPLLGKLLTLWKDADPGLPLLKEAFALKHELEKKP
jgi:tetratricopeptide (TPR) repeat protein